MSPIHFFAGPLLHVFFLAYEIASLTRSCRQSAGRVPLLACRMAYTICSSKNFDCLINRLRSSKPPKPLDYPSLAPPPVCRGDVWVLGTISCGKRFAEIIRASFLRRSVNVSQALSPPISNLPPQVYVAIDSQEIDDPSICPGSQT